MYICSNLLPSVRATRRRLQLGFYFSLLCHYETWDGEFSSAYKNSPNLLLSSLACKLLVATRWGGCFLLFQPFTIRFPPQAAFLLNSFKLLIVIKRGFHHNELMGHGSAVSILTLCRQDQCGMKIWNVWCWQERCRCEFMDWCISLELMRLFGIKEKIWKKGIWLWWRKKYLIHFLLIIFWSLSLPLSQWESLLTSGTSEVSNITAILPFSKALSRHFKFTIVHIYLKTLFLQSPMKQVKMRSHDAFYYMLFVLWVCVCDSSCEECITSCVDQYWQRLPSCRYYSHNQEVNSKNQKWNKWEKWANRSITKFITHSLTQFPNHWGSYKLLWNICYTLNDWRSFTKINHCNFFINDPDIDYGPPNVHTSPSLKMTGSFT